MLKNISRMELWDAFLLVVENIDDSGFPQLVIERLQDICVIPELTKDESDLLHGEIYSLFVEMYRLYVGVYEKLTS